MHTDQQIENLAIKVDELRRDIQSAGSAPSIDQDRRLNILERFMADIKKWQMIIPRAAGDGTGPAPTVTAADSGVYLNGTTVQLGTNPFIENVVLDGVSQNYQFTITGMDSMSFQDMTDFVVGTTTDVANISLVGRDGVDIRTTPAGVIQLQTPAVGTAGLNWVLSNIGINGEAEWVNPAMLPTNIPSMICDTDQDTCVETERTADDDTIRFKANNTDILTATDAAFDVFGGVDINLSRDAFSGTYTLFNDATSPTIFGADAAGVAWSDADEILANFVARQTGESTNSYENTAVGITSKISANPSDSRINYVNTVSFDNLLVVVGPQKINLSASQTTNSTEIELTAFEILIDSKSKPFKLNEGTTATGTGAATNGMVLTLQDNTTGEAKWASLASEPLFEVSQFSNGGTSSTVTTIGTRESFQYDTTIAASPAFTLGAGGVITCNTTGDYRVTAICNMGTQPLGSVGIVRYRLSINGLPQQANVRQLFHRNSEFQEATLTQYVSLTAGQTLEAELVRSGGNRQLTSGADENRLIINTA